jgi:hypothetical protein
MTGRLPGLRRLRQSITPQAIDEASIRRDIWSQNSIGGV